MMPGERLFTPADLAELFGISERQFMDWRREHGWAHVRVGRTIRFTQEQVDHIVNGQTVTTVKSSSGTPTVPVAIAGQSKASAARGRVA